MFLELDYLALKVFQVGRELLTALFTSGREVVTFEDSPFAQVRCHDVVKMLAWVIDAVFGHQHAVAAEIGHALTGHPEVLYDVGNRLNGLIGCEIKRCAAYVPIENHVQVLVGGDASQHPVCDRVVARLTRIAVDPYCGG